MKLWQKVYLATMILFVVLLNVGMYVVFELTYQKDIAVEQNQAQVQYNILASGLTRSLDSMYQQGDVTEGKLESRAPEHGKDEIARLGRHFNRMADKIQENIELIQREADAKQEFVDNFAHELKSPLTSIYGFAEYLQKANVPEDDRMQCLGYIMDESKLLLQLSYNLLDMAKIRNEEMHIDDVCLDDIEEQIKKRMDTLCQERKVTLMCKRSVRNMQANEVLLYSLLCNLIQNAIYACDSGDTVSWDIEEKEDKVRICIEDNGCGMTKEQVKRVKEPFYRVDKARSREVGRTGLSLTICAQIVEYHNGQMDIQSEINKGTVVTILIPKKFTV